VIRLQERVLAVLSRLPSDSRYAPRACRPSPPGPSACGSMLSPLVVDEGVTTEDLEILRLVQPLKPAAIYRGPGSPRELVVEDDFAVIWDEDHDTRIV